MSKSDYLENALQRHMAGIAAFTAPATWHVALFTTSPNDAGGGTECTGGSYVRRSLTPGAGTLSVTGNVITNLADLLFPVLSGSIGTIVGFGIYDAASAGNMLYRGDLAAPDQKTYILNDQPIIPAGSLTITED